MALWRLAWKAWVSDPCNFCNRPANHIPPPVVSACIIKKYPFSFRVCRSCDSPQNFQIDYPRPRRVHTQTLDKIQRFLKNKASDATLSPKTDCRPFILLQRRRYGLARFRMLIRPAVLTDRCLSESGVWRLFQHLSAFESCADSCYLFRKEFAIHHCR